MYCPRCRYPLNANNAYCPRCGLAFYNQQRPHQQQMPPQYRPPQYPMPRPQRKNRGTAIIFAFVLGGVGVHKFYLGHYVQGAIYVAFCWTLIPAIIGAVEGTIYACQNDEQFHYIHSRRSNTNLQ